MEMINEIVQEIKNISPTQKDLRNFGITFAVILGVIAIWTGFAGSTSWWIWALIGGLFLILGFSAKNVLKPFFKVWMSFACVLGYFVSRFILILLFYLVMTPLGLVMRLLGKDLLDEKIDPKAKSYWHLREQGSYDPARTEKMY